MNDLISVIVPIYKVQDYIDACIKSLINQDYNEIEIILVDDGSPDKCLSICDDYSKKDKRIKVIHKENGGVSSARNRGMDIAKGKYITFVDGDDFVDSDYISYLVKIIKSNDGDIGINLKHHSIFNNSEVIDNIRIEKSEKIIEGIYIGNVDVAVWNKIYKKEFLINNNISFNEKIWYGEGMLFNIQCLQYSDNIAVGGKKVYHQVYNINSAMRNFSLNSNKCGIMSLDIQKAIMIKTNNDIMNAWNLHKYCFNFSIVKGLIKSNQVSDYYDDYKKCIKNLKKDHFVSFKTNIKLKNKIKFLIISLFPVFMAKRSIRKEYRIYSMFVNR